MNKFFKIRNMRERIVRSVYIITFVVITVFFVILNITTLNMRVNEYSASCSQRMAAAAKEIDGRFSQMIYIESNISSFPDIVNVLKKEKIGNLYNKYILTSRIEEIIEVYRSSMEYESTVIIYPIFSDIPESKYINSLERIKSTAEWDLVKTFDKSYKSLWHYSKENEEIALYKGIFDENKILGYIKIGLPCEDIVSVAEKMRVLDDEYIQLEIDGNVAYESGKICDNIKELTLLNGGKIKIGMSVIGIYFREKLFLIISILCYVVFCLALHAIYKGIIGAVTAELYDFLEQMSNTNDIMVDSMAINMGGNGEIGAIKRQFKMLIEKLLESNRQKQQMKFDMLQNGINPHLLYNSLSALRWHMLKQNNNDVAEIIECMASYYRSVLSKGEYIITLEKELDLVRQYINISGFCYRRKYQYVVNVSDEALKCRIIKLLIQPFIENAVLHGISNIEDGIIIMSINIKNDILCIDIKDNGYGMSEKTLKDIDAGIPNSKYSGYAIKNTVNRIKSYYGEQYGISIESKTNEGTRVTIEIPAVYGKKEEYRYED